MRNSADKLVRRATCWRQLTIPGEWERQRERKKKKKKIGVSASRRVKIPGDRREGGVVR